MKVSMRNNMRSWTMRSLCLMASLTLGGAIATTANAQTPVVPSVPAGVPFKVAFDHDGLNVTHFRLMLNGVQVVELPASSRANGVVTVDMAPLTIGAYSVVAVARNAPTAPFTNPSEASTAPYAFEVRTTATVPNPPVWRQTTIFYADGSMRLESIVALLPVPPVSTVLRLMADGTARVEQ